MPFRHGTRLFTDDGCRRCLTPETAEPCRGGATNATKPLPNTATTRTERPTTRLGEHSLPSGWYEHAKSSPKGCRGKCTGAGSPWGNRATVPNPRPGAVLRRERSPVLPHGKQNQEHQHLGQRDQADDRPHRGRSLPWARRGRRPCTGRGYHRGTPLGVADPPDDGAPALYASPAAFRHWPSRSRSRRSGRGGGRFAGQRHGRLCWISGWALGRGSPACQWIAHHLRTRRRHGLGRRTGCRRRPSRRGHWRPVPALRLAIVCALGPLARGSGRQQALPRPACDGEPAATGPAADGCRPWRISRGRRPGDRATAAPPWCASGRFDFR